MYMDTQKKLYKKNYNESAVTPKPTNKMNSQAAFYCSGDLICIYLVSKKKCFNKIYLPSK